LHQAVIDSLDGRDATAEGPLKKKLRENLPSLTREMAHDTVRDAAEMPPRPANTRSASCR